MDVKLKPKVQEQYDILAEALDLREKPFQLLKEFEDTNGFFPAEYRKDVRFYAAYEEWKQVGSWRTVETIVKRLVEVATITVENEKKKKNKVK